MIKGLPFLPSFTIYGKNRHGKSFFGNIRLKSRTEKYSYGQSRTRMIVFYITFYLSVMVLLCDGDGQVEPGFKSFGSPCDGPLECNRNLWFECHQGKCSCTHPTATIYDSSLNRCIGRLGSSCFQFGVGPYCQANSICKLVQHPNLSRHSRHGSQQYMGICQGVLSSFGEDCDDDGAHENVMKQCDEKMKCQQGKCDCNSNQSQYYDETKKKCSIMPGGTCHPSWKNVCGKNSMCRPMDRQKTMYTCQCDHDSSLDSTGECKTNYLKSCKVQSGLSGRSRICNQDRFLECLDGICVCQNPLSQMYSLKYNKCVGLVDSKCANGGRKLLKVADNSSKEVPEELEELEATHCTENAECVDGTCRCKVNHFETPVGTCKEDIAYGTVCQDGQCNHFKGMVCRHGQCLCLDPAMKYDEKQKTCMSPIGYTCGKVSVDGIHGNQIVSLMCLDRARCSETLAGSFKCSF